VRHYDYSSSCDLHVLGTPPAFILSQDQTLRLLTRNFCFRLSIFTVLLLRCFTFLNVILVSLLIETRIPNLPLTCQDQFSNLLKFVFFSRLTVARNLPTRLCQMHYPLAHLHLPSHHQNHSSGSLGCSVSIPLIALLIFSCAYYSTSSFALSTPVSVYVSVGVFS
jgi:hypothetical protein